MSYDLDVESAVGEKYGAASRKREDALCCPVEYDPKFLKLLPAEILERDYGCGDASRFVREGETVLDLGSGAGKICYIAAQMVGAGGSVIGVAANRSLWRINTAARWLRKSAAETRNSGADEFRICGSI